ncbi:MAG: PD40 domain-containing protein [Ignavibacteriae bacterium]|nr:PD40 domain-containing protein [Ignavibacteriota bacterium]
MTFISPLLLLLLLRAEPYQPAVQDTLIYSNERHLMNVRQLTFGGQNAEGYFSFDEKMITFQSTRDTFRCDQQYTMNLQTLKTKLISTGMGRTTCGYFFPDNRTVLFASTHHLNRNCPPPPDYSRGYVWQVSPEYDIFTVNLDGSNLEPLTTSPRYDAEATISPVGDRIVFTSLRNGDLDLYTMNLDGTNIRQLTDALGYDGGAFFSWDGKRIVYRAWHYSDSADAQKYRGLLSQDLVRPSRMEIFVMDADGSNKRQITNNGAANFAPFFLPGNKRIIFASNLNDPRGRNFDLYIINDDGTGLEQVTFNPTFDSFPMFTRDGKRLVFASNRNGKVQGETNLFIADWND